MRRKCKCCGRVRRVMLRNGENNYCSAPCAFASSRGKLVKNCDFCHKLLTSGDLRAVVFVEERPVAKVYCSIDCALKDCGFESVPEDSQ